MARDERMDLASCAWTPESAASFSRHRIIAQKADRALPPIFRALEASLSPVRRVDRLAGLVACSGNGEKRRAKIAQGSPPDQDWSTTQATSHKKAKNSHVSRHGPRSGLGLRLDATRLGSRASPSLST